MKTTLTAAAMLVLAAGAAQAQRELHLFNWGDYTSPELIAKFEAETGIRVTITDYDSNDTALARVRAGGHGFDLVVPSGTFVPIWIAEGLVQPLDHAKLPNIGNIEPRWKDVPFDPGRAYSVPWLWGTTGVIVNTAIYGGDINTADIFLNPPPELHGRINVIPEMSDVMALAIYATGETDSCTSDPAILRTVRDKLIAAKPKWLAMDYGTIEAYAAGDIAAGIYWNGASLRARLMNPDLAYGYPVTGYPLWMDNVMLLADARNVEEAHIFMNYILEPQHAAMLSNFARYANGIIGSEAYLDEVMKVAPEIVIPEEFVAAGRWGRTCPVEVQHIHAQIWTELMR
jgi:spermidine/putrescine transport system substrate-binding protein